MVGNEKLFVVVNPYFLKLQQKKIWQRKFNHIACLRLANSKVILLYSNCIHIYSSQSRAQYSWLAGDDRLCQSSQL